MITAHNPSPVINAAFAAIIRAAGQVGADRILAMGIEVKRQAAAWAIDHGPDTGKRAEVAALAIARRVLSAFNL